MFSEQEEIDYITSRRVRGELEKEYSRSTLRVCLIHVHDPAGRGRVSRLTSGMAGEGYI